MNTRGVERQPANVPEEQPDEEPDERKIPASPPVLSQIYVRSPKNTDLMQLSSTNFDEWDLTARSLFYSAGWFPFYKAAFPEVPVKSAKDVVKVPDNILSETHRKLAWGLLFQSLGYEIKAQVRPIPLGEVEELLFTDRNLFFKDSFTTRSLLRNQLANLDLSKHQDLGGYISHVFHICQRLANQGHPVTSEDRLQYLLRGLPSEYEPIRLNIYDYCSNNDCVMAWEATTSKLLDFVRRRKNIPGAPNTRMSFEAGVVSSAGSASSHTVSDNSTPRNFPGSRVSSYSKSKEVCRDFLVGRCTRGARCRFAHIDKPRNCTHPGCDNPHTHDTERCFLRKWEMKRAAAEAEKKDSNNHIQASHPRVQQLLPGFRSDHCSMTRSESMASYIGPESDDRLGVPIDYQGESEKAKLSNRVCPGKYNRFQWLIDSGSTCHITFDARNCYDIVEDHAIITVGGQHQLKSYKSGTCSLIYDIEGRTTTITLKRVRIVPDFGQNIIAENLFLATGCLVTKTKSSLKMNNPAGLCIMNLVKHVSYGSPLFVLTAASMVTLTSQVVEHSALARSYAPGISDLELWHRRLGHRNFADVARILQLKLPAKAVFCQDCVECKSTHYPLSSKNSIKQPLHEAPRPGYLLHTDTAGPFRVETRGGKKYALLFIDDYSRKLFLFLLRSLSETLPVFQEFIAQLEAEFGRDKVVAQLLADNFSSYTQNAMAAFCKKKGIYQIFSAPYSHYLNPVAERSFRTLVEMSRTMLRHANAPRNLYGEAMHYGVYILNRCPRYFRSGHYGTPQEQWSTIPKPDLYKNIKVWGCAAWPLGTSQNVDKLLPKATKHILLGLDPHNRGYRLGQLPHMKIVHSAHVTFNETMFPCRSQEPTRENHQYELLPAPPITATTMPHMEPDFSPPQATGNTRPSRQWKPSNAFLRNMPDVDSHPAATVSPSTSVARHSQIVEQIFAAQAENTPIPPSDHGQAMASPEAPLWRQGQIAEVREHIACNTIGPAVIPPPGARIIPASWVFSYKHDLQKGNWYTNHALSSRDTAC